MKRENNVTINDIKELVSEFKNRLEIATELKCEVNVFITDQTAATVDSLFDIMQEMFIENYEMSPKYMNKQANLNNKIFKNRGSEIIAYRQIYCYVCVKYLNVMPLDIVTSKLGIDRTNGVHYIKTVESLLSINDSFYTGLFKEVMKKIGMNEKIV